MERVLIGLMVLGFMLGTMLVAARLAVGRPGATRHGLDPRQPDHPTQTGSAPAESARLVDSALRSAQD